MDPLPEVKVNGTSFADGSIPNFGIDNFGKEKAQWKTFSKDELERLKLKPLETNRTKVLGGNVQSGWEYPGTEG